MLYAAAEDNADVAAWLVHGLIGELLHRLPTRRAKGLWKQVEDD